MRPPFWLTLAVIVTGWPVASLLVAWLAKTGGRPILDAPPETHATVLCLWIAAATGYLIIKRRK
jgi:hypothetical protein